LTTSERNIFQLTYYRRSFVHHKRKGRAKGIRKEGGKRMSLMKDVKEEAEIRKKRNQIRMATWVIVAIVLVLVWYFTK
jgi:2-phospho-L-lactate guanylyltransferase (CobY/MobA/RfbA family)